MKNRGKVMIPAVTGRFLVFVIAMLLLTALITMIAVPWGNRLKDPVIQEQLKEWIDTQGVWGWFVLLGIQILQVIIAFIPGEPVEILAGVLFGAWGGLLLCMIGSVIASVVVFSITRTFGLPLLYRLFGWEKVERFAFFRDSQKVERAAFLLFLIPGTPKDLLTYVAGASKIRMSRFLLITTFARIPSILTGTIAGDTLLDNWRLSAAIFLLTGLIGFAGMCCKTYLEDLVVKISAGRKEK